MNTNRNLSRHPLVMAIYEATLAVEACGASPELTAAVIKVSKLKDAAHDLLDQLEARPATIALPVVDLGQSLETSEADARPWPDLGARLSSPGLTSGIGAFDGVITSTGIVVDGIMAMADEYAQAPHALAAAELRQCLQVAIDDLRADVGPKPGVLHPVDEALYKTAIAQRNHAWSEVDRLNGIINTPKKDDFLRAVSTEAEHQRQRWGSDHDAGKTPADWFWLVGYLAGKALHAHTTGDTDKAEHHVITTAAALANWHLAMFGKTDMRPGINPERVAANDQQTEAAA